MPPNLKQPLFQDGNHQQKGGRSTSIGGWRRRKTHVVSLDGATGVLGINVCIV
jgi:hypothetical protein